MNKAMTHNDLKNATKLAVPVAGFVEAMAAAAFGVSIITSDGEDKFASDGANKELTGKIPAEI